MYWINITYVVSEKDLTEILLETKLTHFKFIFLLSIVKKRWVQLKIKLEENIAS